MRLPLTLLGLSVVTPTVQGQSSSQPNRFTAAAWLPFNISARFEGSGAFAARTNPGPPTGTTVHRDYDDGYVRVDSDGNAGGVTWYWGYRDATQVPGDDTLLMHSSIAVPAGQSTAYADDPSLGFELAYLREFSRNGKFAWGLRASFGYADIDIADSQSVLSPAQRLTDSYPLNGIIPPGDPSLPGWQYQGAYDLPGPVINSEPQARQFNTVPDGAFTSGRRDLDTSLFVWKLGPWFELPLTRRLWATAGGGLAIAYAESDFAFNETTTIAGADSLTATGHGSDSDVQVGAYAQLGFGFNLSTRWSLFALGEYQYLAEFTTEVAGHRATLDLGNVWSLQTGIGFSF